MFFKFTKNNPFRDFVHNVTKITTAKISEEEKLQEYKNLFRLMQNRLKENEFLLNSSPAFAKRCRHWNQLEVSSIKPVTSLRNPWLAFKREFEKAITLNSGTSVSSVQKALAWFSYNNYVNDWIND